MSEYRTYSVQRFVLRLALDIQHRLGDFAAYIVDEQRKNPEKAEVMSKEDWTQEYLKWHRRQFK